MSTFLLFDAFEVSFDHKAVSSYMIQYDHMQEMSKYAYFYNVKSNDFCRFCMKQRDYRR